MILRKSLHALYTWDDYTCEWPRRPHHHHHLLSAHFIIWPLSLLSGERKMCRSFISAGGLSKLFLSVQMSMCDQWLVASGQHSLHSPQSPPGPAVERMTVSPAQLSPAHWGPSQTFVSKLGGYKYVTDQESRAASPV